MKYILTESQLKNLIKYDLDVDITVDIVRNIYELPHEFDFLGERYVNQFLNRFGPMYVITLNKKSVFYRQLFLVQLRTKGRWMIVDESDVSLSEFEVMKKLGIEVLGLDIDTLINQYYEEESLNEQVTDEVDDNIAKIIQSYLDMNLSNYYGIKRFWVYYNEQFDDYIVNIFFDKQLAIEMGGAINMLIRRATNEIGGELKSFFEGVNLVFHQHFED